MDTVEAFRAWLLTKDGLVYLARRVRVSAKAVLREEAALEAWFARHPNAP